jgi:pre-mRNA-splicing factor CWC22
LFQVSFFFIGIVRDRKRKIEGGEDDAIKTNGTEGPTPAKKAKESGSPAPPKKAREKSPTPSKKVQDRSPTPKKARDRSPTPSKKPKDKSPPQEKQPEPPPKKAKDDRSGILALTTRTGGAYIPPAKLRMLQQQITDKTRYSTPVILSLYLKG